MTYVLVALVVGLGAAAQAASGFGFALLAVPLLALLVGAKTAVVTTGVVGLALQFAMTLRSHTAVRRPTVVAATLAGLAGMPIGLLILDRADERTLTVVIAATVLAFTLALARGVRVPVGAATDAVAGFASGTLATSTGTSGGPLVIALHAREMPPVAFRATLAAQFTIQGAISVIAFALAGRITGEIGRLALAGLPALALGWLAGERIFARLDHDRFRRVVLVMLALSALAAVVGALAETG
jgi:uncharacterized membrane protein YfcA